jgi:hypothetical protein
MVLPRFESTEPQGYSSVFMMSHAGAKRVWDRWGRGFRIVSVLLILPVGIFAALSSTATGSPPAKSPRTARPSKARSKGKPHCKKHKGRRSSGRCHKKPPKTDFGKGKPKQSPKPSQPGSLPTQPPMPGPTPTQPAPGGSEPPPDLTPPDTAIDSGPPDGATLFEGSVSFAFFSPDGGAVTFECSLDFAAFSACQSPIDYTSLPSGSHSFKVRAFDAAGNRDPTPASRGFKVDLNRTDTTITARPQQTVVPDSTQELGFASDDPGATFECRVGVGAFVPCASPWSISVGAPGDYSGEVRAIGSNGQPDPTPASFTLHAAEPEQRCGALTHDEIWSTDTLSGIVLTCGVSIPDGIKLEVGPGVFVKSAGGAIEVEGGTLEAPGTAAHPVTFTSLKDDSVGGDTNGDGGGSSPAAGDWGGLLGNGGDNGAGDSSSPATISLAHTTIAYPEDGVRTSQTAVTMTDGAARACANACMALYASDGVPDPVISNNTFGASGNDAVVIAAPVALDKLGGNTFTGSSGFGAIVFNEATVDHSGTFPATGSAMLGLEGAGASLTVDSGMTAGLAAGTTVKAGNEGWTGEVGSCCSGPRINVKGTLEAPGTAAHPVTFTSLKDDSVGGDTNGDGGGSSPAAGDWGAVEIADEGSLDLEFAEMAYAAVGVNSTSSSELVFEHNIFAFNSTALNIAATLGTNAAIHDNWFDENGMALDGSSDWVPVETPLTSCQYVPSMSASDNVYGAQQVSTPFVSGSELIAIEAALLLPEAGSSPDGWTDSLAVGPTDHVTWSILPCQPIEKKPPHSVVATPFDFG